MSLTIDEAIKNLFITYLDKRDDLSITIEAGFEWDNDKQKRKKKLQYQVFTWKNHTCMPAPDIEGAVQNAIKKITGEENGIEEF